MVHIESSMVKWRPFYIYANLTNCPSLTKCHQPDSLYVWSYGPEPFLNWKDQNSRFTPSAVDYKVPFFLKSTMAAIRVFEKNWEHMSLCLVVLNV